MSKFKSKPFKAKPFKSGVFIGSFYSRGGRSRDKHGNTTFIPQTFRNVHSGLVVNSTGKVLGVERNRRHSFGSDPRKVRIGVRQTAQKKAIMAQLRKRRRI